jgi:hypothetical protein
MSKKMEEKVDYSTPNFEVDDSPIEVVPVQTPVQHTETEEQPKKEIKSKEPIVNILRNEKITIRHIPREGGMVTNPKHILYGGMAEGATRTFVVPRLRSGAFVNVLTKEEKAFLEDAMGMEYNTLSALKKPELNFWKDISVRLTKQDNYLDLSSPMDYIKYKVLLANKDFIAPSLQALQDDPKATYQFVIIAEGEENRQARDNMSAVMKCYKEYGKVENDPYTLRVIIESIDGRNTAPNSKLEFLQEKINNLIQADSKLFLRVITDPYLNTKVLIKKAVEAGVISNRDNHYYLREGNVPLCEANEESTLTIAAKYLNAPKHQDVLFAIQAKVKE